MFDASRKRRLFQMMEHIKKRKLRIHRRVPVFFFSNTYYNDLLKRMEYKNKISHLLYFIRINKTHWIRIFYLNHEFPWINLEHSTLLCLVLISKCWRALICKLINLMRWIREVDKLHTFASIITQISVNHSARRHR